MREIKFRAWDAKEKQMLEVNHLFNLGNKQPIEVWTNDYEGGYRFNPDKSELMQYTGLKDMNGVEIYECDVVRFDTNVQILESEVTYYHGMFTIKKYGEKIPLFTALKVIGNKFENPKLLEAE